MLKIKESKKGIKKVSILLLASVMLTSVYKSNVSTVNAYEKNHYESIDNDLVNCHLSQNIKDILREIKKSTNNDNVLKNISNALEESDSSEHFIAQAISSFAQEQKKIKFSDAYLKDQYNPYCYMNYNIDDISIINNLNMQILGFPKQLCLLTKIADFGEFYLYEMYSDKPCYVIATKAGYGLTISTGDNIKEKTIRLNSLEEFLVNNDMSDKVKCNYSYFDLINDLTFDISEKLSKYVPCEYIKTEDTLVIDTTKSLSSSRNIDQDYYFLKYAYPYLFMAGNDVYKDVANLDAKITIDNLNTLNYFDKETDITMYDLDYHFLDGGLSTSCLVKLADFLRFNGIYSIPYVTDDLLQNMNVLYNAKENNDANKNNSR